MVKALILYYLNIKPTHGYEIQKFLLINGIEKWTKLHSGSIYYALSKLELDGLIQLQKEETAGSKVRKIYEITDKGREQLKELLKEEMNKEISPVGSNKFVIYSYMMNKLSKDELISIIGNHIENLKKKKNYWELGKKINITNDGTKRLEEITFDMTISSLNYQITWHETLIEEIDNYILISDKMEKMIESVDFSTINEGIIKAGENEIQYIQKIKHEMINNPDKIGEKVDELVVLLRKKNNLI